MKRFIINSMAFVALVGSMVGLSDFTTGVDIEVVTVIEGDRGPGFKAAANVMGAVGPKHVVDFTIAGFTVHDKATGKILRHQSQLEFWRAVQPAKSLDPSPHANDPWMVYDPLSERWFATIAGTGTGESYLAVSTAANPLQPWKGVSLPLPRVDPGLKIGVDRNGVYISCANGSENPRVSLDMYVIPKADATNINGPSLERGRIVGKLIYAAFPAVHVGADQKPETPAVLINNEFGGPTCSELYLYRITWTGTRADISKAQAIPLSRAYSVPKMEGIQPDEGVKLLQAGGRRNNCAFVHGGSVFSCNGAQRTADSRPGILWYEVRIKDGALLQEGFVDSPDCDYLYPSIAVDGRGNIGIGCTRTSSKDYPSVCVMMHAAGDPAGSMRTPVVAVKGTTAFRYSGVPGMNFSNYSTTCIDPSDCDLLWTYQGYANSKVDRQWCSAWTAFKLPAKPTDVENRDETVQQKSSDTETFTGTAAASGTYKRPLLIVDDVRYELKASDKANGLAAETLTKFSKGATGTYTVKGTRGTVNGKDGILVESITPAKADPGASKIAKRPGYTIYDRAEGEHKFRLVIPNDLAVVRGILVVGPYSGGDSRDYHEQAWYREFMNLHEFAFLGATNYYCHDYSVMQNALKQLASDTKHPELVNAPYVVTGFSAGGGYTRKLMRADPDKVIAGVVVGSTMKLPGPLTDDHRHVPMCIINGELEREPGEGPGMAKHLEPVLAEHRPKGALWGWMAVQGVGHEFAGQEVLSMPILDAAVRLRYPADADVRKGPVKLKPIALESGWIADNTSWASGLTAITPAKEFKGNIAKSSWLLNEDIAFIYRAYSTLEWPLRIISPDPMSAKGEVFSAGSSVTIKVDDSKFAGWKKLELHDGAKKVGELAEGPARFLVEDLQAGYHTFSILGTDARGNTRSSNPVLVVVRQ